MAIPKRKDSVIRDLQSALMGADVIKCIEADICVNCGCPATEFKNEKSQREFALSGLCQKCQDDIFS